jgi:hypothetical protein
MAWGVGVTGLDSSDMGHGIMRQDTRALSNSDQVTPLHRAIVVVVRRLLLAP